MPIAFVDEAEPLQYAPRGNMLGNHKADQAGQASRLERELHRRPGRFGRQSTSPGVLGQRVVQLRLAQVRDVVQPALSEKGASLTIGDCPLAIAVVWPVVGKMAEQPIGTLKWRCVRTRQVARHLGIGIEQACPPGNIRFLKRSEPQLGRLDCWNLGSWHQSAHPLKRRAAFYDG